MMAMLIITIAEINSTNRFILLSLILNISNSSCSTNNSCDNNGIIFFFRDTEREREVEIEGLTAAADSSRK